MIRRPHDYIECGHQITWRWESYPTEGAFCYECMRVFSVRTRYPEPIRKIVARWLRDRANQLDPQEES